jgi:rhodanese-related sulfurtransferase
VTKKRLFHTLAEILLIVLVSAAAGVAWNRTLLTSAWHGELTQQAQAAAPAGEEIPMPIGLAQVKELLDAKQAVVLDARSIASFHDGHIAGAVAAPLEEAKRHPSAPLAAKLAKDATIIAYCNGFSCHDSMELGKILMQAGYTSVYVYEGGFPEWRDAGYATATGAI